MIYADFALRAAVQAWSRTAPPVAAPAPQVSSPWGLWYFLSSLNSLCSPVPGRARSLVAVPRPSSSSSLERAGRGPSLRDGTHTGTRERGERRGAAPCPPSSSSLGPRQLYALGFPAPKDPYWSPVRLLSAMGLSPNPRVATTSSSSSNNTSSFFRIGVSPGVSGIDGPRGQNAVHRCPRPIVPSTVVSEGVGGVLLCDLDLGVWPRAAHVSGLHAGSDAPHHPKAPTSQTLVQRHR